MIFKKIATCRLFFVICLAGLQLVISCNRNPAGENFGADLEIVNMYYNLENLLTIGQDTSGRLFFMDSGNVSVYTYDSSLKYTYDSPDTDSISEYSHGLLIKDIKGSLLFLSDSNVCRIKSNRHYFEIDTIESFSYITQYPDGRYSVDDSGNVWFYDMYDLRVFDDATLSLQKWDGERLQDFLIAWRDSLKSPKFLHLAAGKDNVFLLYLQVDYPKSSECSLICKRWDKIQGQVTRSESGWDLEMNFEAAFVAGQKLYVMYHNSWSSEVYLKELFDTKYNSPVTIGDSISNFRLLKRNADEVFLYSQKKIVQITDRISEKIVYSDCGALFLDTLNQVISYDRYRKKFINISTLPGF
jgi:hypothetical protein